jgi:regulator of sigma E protease
VLSTSIIATVLTLGVLIFVHELGHFLAAKLFGVGVRRFSLGFGPPVISKVWRGTDYRISSLPLGGYVKMVGEAPGDEIPPEEEPASFTHKSVSRRFAIVAAGPFFNLAFAVLVFFAIFAAYGVPVVNTQVGDVKPGYPAAQAGLAKGDVIVAVDGQKVERWEDLSKAIRSHAKTPLRLVIDRNGRLFERSVTPRMADVPNIFGETVVTPVIGIGAGGEVRLEPVGILTAGGRAVEETYQGVELTLLSIWKLIERVIPANTLGGPILIAQIAGQQAERGILNLLTFAAWLSVNLGVLNMLPIPILDGGHLFFFGLEGVMGRPVSLRKREVAQQVGLFLLLMLMIFVFYNDISRIVMD